MRIIKRVSNYEIVQRNSTVQKTNTVLEYWWKGRRSYDQTIFQLNKYGFFGFRNRAFYLLLLLSLGGYVVGGFITKYMHELYQNELKTIGENRYLQHESSPILLFMQRAAVSFVFWFESRLFTTNLFAWGYEMDVRTESMIRVLQIRNYKKNKDRRTEFANLGVMEKFPYPRYNQALTRV